MDAKKGEKREAEDYIGRWQFNKQGNPLTGLSQDDKLSTAMLRNLRSLYRGLNGVHACVPGGLSTTVLSQAVPLKISPLPPLWERWADGHSRYKGRGEDPPIALVHHAGQLAVMSLQQ